MSFEKPEAESLDDFTFGLDGNQLRMAKSLAYRRERNGNDGRNRLCG